MLQKGDQEDPREESPTKGTKKQAEDKRKKEIDSWPTGEDEGKRVEQGAMGEANKGPPKAATTQPFN